MKKIRTIRALFCIILLAGMSPLYAGEVYITIEGKRQIAPHDTVVELVGNSDISLAPMEVEISQHDREFTSEISVVSRGSSVLFSNDDPFQHHVYSVSKGNQFDLPLYQDKPSRLIEFDNNGIVKLGCNIHDWMLAFVYVSESPHFVITDASGKAHFTGIPAGEYQLRVWNPRLRNNKKIITQSLSISDSEATSLTLSVSLRKNIRKPERPKSYGGYDY